MRYLTLTLGAGIACGALISLATWFFDGQGFNTTRIRRLPSTYMAFNRA